MKIIFSPAISPAAWAIGESLLPKGFTIEILSREPEQRTAQLKSADFLMGFLRGMPLKADDYPHLRNVKLIQLLSAGYDGVDLARLRQSGILLNTTGETLTWKMIMSVQAGVLIFDLDGGNSSTWGAFGSTVLSSVPTTLTNLDGYSPAATVENSGIGFASNRVTSLKLKKVIYRRLSGAVTEDNTIRVLHSVE